MATRSVISKNIAEASSTYVGVDGELILDTVTNTLKISDGSTAGGVTLTTSSNSGATLTGSTNNQLVTVTGADAITGESNLTFNGSTLAVTGAITGTSTIIATSYISAMNLSVQLGTNGLQIGNGTNGDDTTYRIIYDANTNDGGSTEIYAKRPGNTGGDTKFWFPYFSDGSGVTRYIMSSGSITGGNFDPRRISFTTDTNSGGTSAGDGPTIGITDDTIIETVLITNHQGSTGSRCTLKASGGNLATGSAGKIVTVQCVSGSNVVVDFYTGGSYSGVTLGSNTMETFFWTGTDWKRLTAT